MWICIMEPCSFDGCPQTTARKTALMMRRSLDEYCEDGVRPKVSNRDNCSAGLRFSTAERDLHQSCCKMWHKNALLGRRAFPTTPTDSIASDVVCEPFRGAISSCRRRRASLGWKLIRCWIMRVLVFGFLIFATMVARGQLAPQGPQPAYNGQNVSAISLVANPRRDQTPLQAVVTQRAGEPYSQQKIDESAEALRRAGNFPKVDVNVVPDITGLRVSFLLEPAYYLGAVEFPGVEKYFSYTRLLQVADLSDEDPYDSARIPLAEKALRDFLVRNGYFQPTVHALPTIDDAHELVNVSFAVEVGRKARLGKVSIQGPDGTETDRLLHATRSLKARLSGGLLKAGKPYSPERIKQATTLMKRTLTRQRRLSATVKEKPPQYDPATNLVDISFSVDVGPVVSVRTVGAKLTVLPFLAGRQMRKLIPIFSEGTVDQDLVEEGQRTSPTIFRRKVTTT
jgi:outer membrane protein assembly factor BamA